MILDEAATLEPRNLFDVGVIICGENVRIEMNSVLKMALGF